MSLQTRNPVRMAGACVNSGSVNTGEVAMTRGGGQTYTSFSGVIADVLILAGGGRLNSTLVYNTIVSGQGVIFYDSAVATSGGPFSTSGHKVVGFIPPVWHQAASGVVSVAATPGVVNQVDMPFANGLVARAVASGSVSFSVSYTPETSGYFVP